MALPENLYNRNCIRADFDPDSLWLTAPPYAVPTMIGLSPNPFRINFELIKEHFSFCPCELTRSQLVASAALSSLYPVLQKIRASSSRDTDSIGLMGIKSIFFWWNPGIIGVADPGCTPTNEFGVDFAHPLRSDNVTFAAREAAEIIQNWLPGSTKQAPTNEDEPNQHYLFHFSPTGIDRGTVAFKSTISGEMFEIDLSAKSHTLMSRDPITMLALTVMVFLIGAHSAPPFKNN